MLLAIFPAVTPLLPISAIAPRARPVWSAEPQPRRRLQPGPARRTGWPRPLGGRSERPAGRRAGDAGPEGRAGPGGAGLRRPSAPPARPPRRGLLKGRPRAGPASAQEAARARGLGPRERAPGRGPMARSWPRAAAGRLSSPQSLPAAREGGGGRAGRFQEAQTVRGRRCALLNPGAPSAPRGFCDPTHHAAASWLQARRSPPGFSGRLRDLLTFLS